MRIGKRELGIDDLAQREQHPLLVVARDLRCAGGQNDLPAVGVDVRAEERDVLLLGGFLDDADEPVQRVGGRVGAVAARSVRPCLRNG